MNIKGLRIEFRPLAAALLAVLALHGTALATDRRVADSLLTAFELSGEGAAFDGTAARLEDYLAHAAKQSPALKAAFYEWQSTLERSGHAGALPDPWFSYTYFIENVETRVGPQIQAFRLRQAFPWFGTLGAKKDVALGAANAVYERFESEKLRLFYRVKSAYYEYYYLGRDIAITRENLELLSFWESVARAKYRVALTQHPDVIKAQVELGKLEDRLRTLEDMAEPAAARLRAVVNLPDSVPLAVPIEITIEEAAVDRDSIIALALANNPDLKSLLKTLPKNLRDPDEGGPADTS